MHNWPDRMLTKSAPAVDPRSHPSLTKFVQLRSRCWPYTLALTHPWRSLPSTRWRWRRGRPRPWCSGKSGEATPRISAARTRSPALPRTRCRSPRPVKKILSGKYYWPEELIKLKLSVWLLHKIMTTVILGTPVFPQLGIICLRLRLRGSAQYPGGPRLRTIRVIFLIIPDVHYERWF